MGILTNRQIHAGDEKYAFIIVILGCIFLIWQLVVIFKYNTRRKHATKCINAVITDKKVIEFNQYIRYNYLFVGADEYKGITFYDKFARVEKSYDVGKKVSLYIDPQDVDKFWFEDEEEPGKTNVVLAIILIFLAVLVMVRAISKY